MGVKEYTDYVLLILGPSQVALIIGVSFLLLEELTCSTSQLDVLNVLTKHTIKPLNSPVHTLMSK